MLLAAATIIFLIVLWSSQQDRLKAYNDCYMEKYQDWSTDCVLTE